MPRTMAEQADPHELYEASVQNVQDECDFIATTFEDLAGRPARRIREDFCGTASACCEWVRRNQAHTAIGVDIDPDVLEWGSAKRVGRLDPDDAERVELICGDVLDVRTAPVDAVCAFNFSYWVFRDRPTMVDYFRRARDSLVDDGILFLDAFGGYEAFEELKEKTKFEGFTYVWHQAEYRPVTGYARCNIHFHFPDGSKIKRAFTYEWRLWTLPEIQEMLLEAGFARAVVYWEGTDESGEGNGVFKPETRGEADAGWIAYVVATK